MLNLTDDGLGDDADLIGNGSGEPIFLDDVPAWSPDSQELAFARTTWMPGDAAHRSTIMRIARDGGEPETVQEIVPATPFAIFTPMHWLEDGRLLFTIARSDIEDGQNGIWKIEMDGSGLDQVLPGNEMAEVPIPWIADVSPDGQTALIYSRLNMGQAQFEAPESIFFQLDLETGEVEPITTGEEPEVIISTPPRFSPDGTSMIYVVSDPSVGRTLVVRDVATGEVTLLREGVELSGSESMARGIDWADNGTVVTLTEDGWVALTLESSE